MQNKMLLKQTIGHFCVDAACAAVVISGTLDIPSAIQFFILYNFLAFCLQPVAGFILDTISKITLKQYILTSFVFLLLGFIPSMNILLRVLLVGIGNCLFHVGSGTLILQTSQKKMAPLGIFVSSGAVGLVLGTIFAYNNIFHLILMVALLSLFLLNLDVRCQCKKQSIATRAVVPSVLLCLCITIRSFMGFTSITQFEKTIWTLIIITFGVFVGKALGGVFCDKWGIKRVVIISTILLMCLFLFSLQNPYLWTIVQMIVNFSMPITLYLMYKSMPRYPAFSFGLAASFLVVGLLLAYLCKGWNVPPACFLILFVINSGIILYTERKLK